MDYDYIVIGGGSGGVSSAKRAAQLYGKRVAVIEGKVTNEETRWGGTCVNVGCVPKKIMYQASMIREVLQHDAHHYNYTTSSESPKLDWKTFKAKRDAYIVRLNHIYKNGMSKAGIDLFEGFGTLVDRNTVQIISADQTTKQITGTHIVIATGGKPMVPAGEGVIEHTITSDGFFDLEEQPKKAIVVGAGYIAVELAGVLNGLGTETHLVVRKQQALRDFDPDISQFLDDNMVKAGVIIHRNTSGVAKVEEVDGKKQVTTISGDVIGGADIVLMAPGRVPFIDIPNVAGLGLETVGVQQRPSQHIIVSDDQQTSVPNIWAIGDVCGKVELTPMAIHVGRRLVDRLFGEKTNYHVSYDLVPTVVFSHPTIGTIGLTEPKAIAKYGADNIKVYKSTFVNLHYSMFEMEPSEKPKTMVKLICAGETEQVVGLHLCGMGADEMLQGFGVAMKMGATKADFDSSVAIHPTASEEIVTLGTWGTSPQYSGAKVSPLQGAAPGEPPLSKM